MIGRLGAGGMGRVYLARSGGGRTVAVKVVRADLAEDGEFRRRFRQEVEVARAVSGPYTAPVVDADTEGQLPWLATVYVLGPSLEDVVAQHGPLPETSVWALAGGLAEALRGIHGAGLVHRDLKPSNILLTADGPRVIDFGIARAIDGERLTSTGVVVGSPGFMSPEQAMGKAVGPEGDVFSLGVVLAYSASGQMPFGMGAPASLLYQVVHEQPDLSKVPEALQALVAACLAKDPGRRPTPEQIAEGVARLGFSVVAGAWLPTQVASTIAQHAARILDLDTPPEGSTPPARQSYTPTQVVPPSGGPASLKSAGGSPSRRRFLAVAATVGTVGLAGAGAAIAMRDGDKPAPKPTPTNSGTATPRRTQWPGGVAPALWAYTAGDPKNSLVAASGSTVILPQLQPLGLAVATGRRKWSGSGTFGHTTGLIPMFVDANAFVALDQKGHVIRVDPSTGRPTWQWPLPSNLVGISAFVAADDKAIYAFGSGSPTIDGPDPGPGKRRTVLLSIDISTRRERWRVVPDGKGPVTVALGTVAGSYLVHTDDGTNALNVRNTADGSKAWSVPFGRSGNYILPAVDNGTVFATDQHVVACDLATGTKKWTKLSHSSEGFFSAPRVKGGVLYIGDSDRGVRALDASDGRQIWSRSIDGGANGNDLVVTDTAVYVASGDQTSGIYALDRRTGKTVWNFRTSQISTTKGIWELADGGNCIVACTAGNVFGLPPV
ncbi:serine/threonine-protein kinase [Streptomyces sp. NPDC001634]|uniref:serine/threonine-protein kinase n=1 Tax=Streptomyces sp. NPDC001634 TaxID=3154390 RepID=UPI0033194BA7